MTLKERKNGQGTSDDLRYRDFKKELLDRERKARQIRERNGDILQGKPKSKQNSSQILETKKKKT